MSERVDTQSRLIRAAAATIYRAFATADAMKTWLPPQGMTARMLAFTFAEGSAYRMRLTYNEPQHIPGKTSKQSDEVYVRFIKLVPNERIEQAVTFTSDDPASSGEMRIRGYCSLLKRHACDRPLRGCTCGNTRRGPRSGVGADAEQSSRICRGGA